MGIVSIVKTGFTMVFKKASTTATKSAVTKLSTFTPGKNLVTIITAAAEMSILRIKLMR